ncbi:hypothetical protein [Hymenobacter latericus]|uniref:hypothetical protein n=1 Tax=Hymenobacter sp. YIM 151858-1 TaxID=2987688 RepID=UPI002226E82D|nr:hypothetical protein [Hymenobacter sp. YIM 151858-1]UYZ57860.1 hypothetical protein OIS50_12410 [Hymenobacter sp. YIM 151858-1]
MAESVVISEPYGDVLLMPDVPCVAVRWHSFANSAQFRSLMDEALAYYTREAQQTWPLGWLFDLRKMSALVPADQLWLETDWNPRAYSLGVRHIGMVSSENIFGRIAAQVYAANTTAREDYVLEPEILGTLEETKRWVRRNL